MCQFLNWNYDISAKRNHKGLSVEHFLRFLNESVYIAVEECDTNNMFVPTGSMTSYAWNSTPIDGTYILRNIPEMDR